MKRSISVAAAFSLVELTLALGIAAFCLIAVFGLAPVAMLTNRNATSRTEAANIMAAVVADLRATPACPGGQPFSKQFGIQFGTSTTLYFDGQGRSSCDPAGLQQFRSTAICSQGGCSGSWSPPLKVLYQLNVTWPSSPTGLMYADLKVIWPATQTTPAPVPSGSVEMSVAFDRN